MLRVNKTPLKGSEGPKPKDHPAKSRPRGTAREEGEMPGRCQGTKGGCPSTSNVAGVE